MYIGLHVKYSLFLSDFNETWLVLTDFLKNPQISNLVESELLHAGEGASRQTDGRTWQLNSGLLSFVNAPKNFRQIS